MVEAAAGGLELFGASLPPNTTGPALIRGLLDRAAATGFNVVRGWAHTVTAQYALQARVVACCCSRGLGLRQEARKRCCGAQQHPPAVAAAPPRCACFPPDRIPEPFADFTRRVQRGCVQRAGLCACGSTQAGPPGEKLECRAYWPARCSPALVALVWQGDSRSVKGMLEFSPAPTLPIPQTRPTPPRNRPIRCC